MRRFYNTICLSYMLMLYFLSTSCHDDNDLTAGSVSDEICSTCIMTYNVDGASSTTSSHFCGTRSQVDTWEHNLREQANTINASGVGTMRIEFVRD